MCSPSSMAWAGRPQSNSTSSTGSCTRSAKKHGLTVVRNLVGSYITSLDMAGCSITLLKPDDDMVKYWDAPVRTPALRWGV